VYMIPIRWGGGVQPAKRLGMWLCEDQTLAGGCIGILLGRMGPV